MKSIIIFLCLVFISCEKDEVKTEYINAPYTEGNITLISTDSCLVFGNWTGQHGEQLHLKLGEVQYRLVKPTGLQIVMTFNVSSAIYDSIRP